MVEMAGRFAPSPTGDLHIGNLRTALVAWLAARSSGRAFVVRMEDLDRVTSSPEHERQQLADLSELGIDWDGTVVRQSERFDRYDAAITRLHEAELTYECCCSRREIRAAAVAPHGEAGRYPGTCRELGKAERERRRAELGASGRAPALRFRSDRADRSFVDAIHGRYTGPTDDVVIRRNDGVPAYNLAVVVDDADQGVDQVVRGDDLLDVTPSQIALAEQLGLPLPRYWHVPLVLGPTGERLAKREGDVTLGDLHARGVASEAVRAVLANSLGLSRPGEHLSLEELIDRFDIAQLKRTAWTFTPDTIAI